MSNDFRNVHAANASEKSNLAEEVDSLRKELSAMGEQLKKAN
jgi:hypothetical protein